MTAPIVERLRAAEELRLDAKAFRENMVYDSDGDPIRLIANAERMERGADTITDLLAALKKTTQWMNDPHMGQ
jgi:ABC-type nitrate/sulfonate/bicarbonate transport system substrate-binding protein